MTSPISTGHLLDFFKFQAKPKIQNAQAQAQGIGKYLKTDIVADVVAAAEPQRLNAGMEKLAANSDVHHKTNQQFEAVMLRSFVEDMLPKDTSAVYGSGTAGNSWRSMQADYISQDMAKAGGIGIAKMLDAADARKAAGINQILPGQQASTQPLNNSKEWPYFTRSIPMSGSASS